MPLIGQKWIFGSKYSAREAFQKLDVDMFLFGPPPLVETSSILWARFW